MWVVRAEDVKHIGRTPGGDHFTEFVNSLIYGWAHLKGLLCSEINANQRTNKQDGGVDTEVCSPVSDDPLGWMNNPTIWQYKATDSSDVSDADLKSEIKKWYATECIIKGYAYRLCICDSIPPYKKKSWEDILNEEIKRINANAPDAKVLTADDLAQWACHLPAITLRFFLPRIATLGLHFNAWGDSITEITPEFIRYPSIDGIINEIQNHVNFAREVPEAVLAISGLPGVGKTRLVYESLLLCEGTKSLTIFTNDEDKAIEIAMTVSNNSMINAILVADECGLEKRLKLGELLKGHKDRVRVIAIDNSGERPPSGSPELWLEKMPPKTVEEILTKNYPTVPAGRRRAYADLSRGFIRFAADLCRNDYMIASAGSVDPALIGIRDYLKTRFSPEELKVIQALSLVTKAGYKDTVSQEIMSLCDALNQEPVHFKEIADRIHDGPGFIAKTGKYLYVTPEIIAQVGFDLGWNYWIKGDPQDFVKKLPKILLEPFYLRVRKSASEGVRSIVGEFFRRWAIELGPAQLNSVETVNRLITLIEVDPGIYLPILRRLIEEATIDELKKVSGKPMGGSYGPRRSLVWMAERIIAFPEYFDHAENILLRLGLAETEENISNNATAIWRQLYRILLSGTAIPFLERLSRLEKRIFLDNEETSRFAMAAFDDILNDRQQRMVGPSIIAGRIPPEEYTPDSKEYLECVLSTILLLRKVINQDQIPDDTKLKAKSVLVDHTRSLLNQGFLEELEKTLSIEDLNDNLKIGLIEEIEEFIYFDLKPKWGRPAIPKDYEEKVNGWLQKIKPSDLKGRLRNLVGSYRGHYLLLDKRDKLESEVKFLAEECLKNPEFLKQEQDYIFTNDARNAFAFGNGLGGLDENAMFLDYIIKSTIHYNSTEFGRGYLSGLLGSYPSHADLVNKKLDEIEMNNPTLAYELFMTRIEATRALERTIKLVDLGKLNASCLGRFAYGRGLNQLSLSDFEKILERLVNAAKTGDTLALQSALEFVSFRIFNEKEKYVEPILEQNEIRSLAWELIEISPEKHKSYHWVQIIEALSAYDPDKAAQNAALGLVEGNLTHLKDFTTFFTALAKSHPEMIMQRVGEVMLDEKLGWKFHVYEFRSLLKAIPDDIIIKWMEEHGVKGARLLARHLPLPYISETGVATVPYITQFILDAFDDEEVFNGFICGVHDFQLYSGDIASQHDKEAEIAREFLSHPSKRIREWAQIEEENALSEAKRWRQTMEERGLD